MGNHPRYTLQSPGELGKEGRAEGRGGGAREVPRRPPPAVEGAATETGPRSCLEVPSGVRMTPRPGGTCLPRGGFLARWVVLPFPPARPRGPGLVNGQGCGVTQVTAMSKWRLRTHCVHGPLSFCL